MSKSRSGRTARRTPSTTSYGTLWDTSRAPSRRVRGPGTYTPVEAPEHEHQWHDLVRLFLVGARAAVALGQAPARLAVEVEPGVTLADELSSVAVHNAYHFGKIVALRQRLDAWPPNASFISRPERP